MTAPINIPWFEIYSSAVSAVWLSAIVRRHASLVAAAARSAREARDAERRHELMRFEAIDLAKEDDSNDDGMDDDSVSSRDSSSALRNQGADRVFRVKSLRPKQHEAVEALAFGDDSNGKLIVVDRTGGGKSLILQMTGISVAGVTLVIVPLLSLTANQMASIKRARTNDIDIHAFHLHKSSIADVKKVLIPKLDDLAEDTSAAIFLLCSP